MSDIEELSKEVHSHSFMLAKKTSELVNEHGKREIEDVFLEKTKQLLNAKDSPEDKFHVITTTVQIGKSIGSEKLLKYAKKQKLALEEKYG